MEVSKLTFRIRLAIIHEVVSGGNSKHAELTTELTWKAIVTCREIKKGEHDLKGKRKLIDCLGFSDKYFMIFRGTRCDCWLARHFLI